MKLCPVCKTECEDGALYCSNCGCALPPTPVGPFTPSFDASTVPGETPAPQESDANPPQREPYQPPQENTYPNAPQKPAYTQHPGYTGSPQGTYGQPYHYAAPQGGAPYGQPQNGYPNAPGGDYQQPPYPNPPKKSKKGLVTGLICGGAVLLVMIAAVCAALFLNPAANSEKESLLEMESSKENEVSFEEESKQSAALPTDPHDINLAEFNPFVTEKDGNVTFTIPSSFFEVSGQDAEDIKDLIQSLGSADIQATTDGGLQVIMSKAAYKLFLSSFDAGLKISFDEMKKSGTFTSVTGIEADSTYSVIKVTVDRTSGDTGFDEYTANLTVSAMGGLYQMLSGVPAEMTMVTVQFVDAATGDVYNEQENINPAQYLSDLM